MVRLQPEQSKRRPRSDRTLGAAPRIHDQHILLTGATGAVGPAIAAELLATGAAAKLYGLIRPQRAPAADDRGAKWAAEVAALIGPDSQDVAGRMVGAAGDLARDDLGLTPAQRD